MGNISLTTNLVNSRTVTSAAKVLPSTVPHIRFPFRVLLNFHHRLSFFLSFPLILFLSPSARLPSLSSDPGSGLIVSQDSWRAGKTQIRPACGKQWACLSVFVLCLSYAEPHINVLREVFVHLFYSVCYQKEFDMGTFVSVFFKLFGLLFRMVQTRVCLGHTF